MSEKHKKNYYGYTEAKKRANENPLLKISCDSSMTTDTRKPASNARFSLTL